MLMTWEWAIAILGSYLCGSVPFGFLIGLARGVDIRKHGSKNIGATNVGRVLGREWGVLAFVLDFLKGVLPVVAAGAWSGALGRTPVNNTEAWLWLGCAAATFAGHVFPVWLGFRGGKGVATGFGAMVGVWPHLTLPALGAVVVWIVTLRLTRYVSVSSCVSAAFFPAAVVGRALWTGLSGGLSVPESTAGMWPFFGATFVLALVLIVRHRANFARLRLGTEPKVGSKPPNSV